MAYNERFRCEFANDAMPVELGWGRTDYTLRFLYQNWSGGVTNLRPAGEPFSLKTEGSQEDIFAPTFPYQATYNLISENFWDAQALWPEDDRQIQLIVEATKNGVTRVIWFGWLQPTDNQEPYASKPYEIEGHAVCGLTLLKSMALVDSNKKRLSGRPTVLTVLQAALNLTGSPLQITTACNLYELLDMAAGQTVGGKAEVSRDPLARTLLNADNLVTTSHETIMAFDAIESVLKPFGCRLAQVNGVWMVLRTIEAVGGWNVWAPGNGDVLTRRYSNPVSYESVDFRVRVGKNMPVQAAKGALFYGLPVEPAISVRQNFGGYINHLKNGDFSQASGGRPTDWDYSTLFQSDEPTWVGDGSEENPYALRIYGSGTNRITTEFRAATQRVILPANSQTKTLNLKLTGRFKLKNTRSAQLYILAVGQSGQYLLKTGGSWILNPKKKELLTITIGNVYRVPGKAEYEPGWQHEKAGYCDIDQSMDPIKNIYALDIGLCVAEALDGQTQNPRPYIEYLDMKLEVVNEGQVMNGITATKKLSSDRKKKDPIVTLDYGDVPDAANATERLGTFFKYLAGQPFADVPTTKWYRPNANAVLNPESGVTLIDQVLNNYASQRMRPAAVFQGSLYGEMPWGVCSVLEFIDVTKPDAQGLEQPIPFQCTKHEWLLRSGKHSVVAVQVNTAPIGRATEKQWETPDGPLTLENGDDGQPESPNKPKLFDETFSKLRPVLAAQKFTLGGTILPAGLVPLDNLIDRRYALQAEVKQNGNLIGLVDAIARKKNLLPPFR